MIVVHHLNNSRSQRILWLLEELDIPYEVKKYQRTAERLAPKELFDIHPLGLSPVITDGDVTLAESGAIVEYIVQKYGGAKAQAVTEPGKLHDSYFKHYAEGTLMPLLVSKLIYSIVPDKTPFFIRPIARMIFQTLTDKTVNPRLEVHGVFLEKHLADGEKQWFAGEDEPTVADYMMSFPLDAWGYRLPSALGPNTRAYIKRMHDRPAYKRALEKGGQYAYAEPTI